MLKADPMSPIAVLQIERLRALDRATPLDIQSHELAEIMLEAMDAMLNKVIGKDEARAIAREGNRIAREHKTRLHELPGQR